MKILTEDEKFDLLKQLEDKKLSLTHNPTSVDFNGLGLLYFKLGQVELARSNFSRAIAMDSGVAHYHYNLGKVYGLLHDCANEVKCYQRAIKRDTYYAAPVFSLGCIYFNNGNYKCALSCFQRVIAIDPTIPQAYCNLGCSYFKFKDYANAIKYFKAALQMDPSSLHTLENMGQTYVMLYKYEQAKECAFRISQLDSQFKSYIIEMISQISAASSA